MEKEVREKKSRLNFWDDIPNIEKLKEKAKEENRDVSNFIRTKLKKIREIEKW